MSEGFLIPTMNLQVYSGSSSEMSFLQKLMHCHRCVTWVFKLSFRHISRLGKGRYFPSLFVFISRHLVFIARAMCVWLNVNVAALCISSAAV